VTTAYAPPSTGVEPAAAPARNVLKWATAFALFLALLAMLSALQLYQMTSKETAHRTLRRSIAVTTEIDLLIARNFDDLRSRADDAGPGEALRLRDYPIEVDLTREEALAATPGSLRDLLLDRSADLMYAEGADPLRDDEPGGGPGRFDAAGAVDHFLSLLRSDVHTLLGVLTIALAGVCLILAVALAALCRGFGRIAGVGAVLLASALPVLILGLLGRLYLGSADDDGEFIRRALFEIGEGLAWIPIRNGAAFGLAGALLLVVGAAGAQWADRRGSGAATT
jgi:hypothetical protein